MSKMLHLRDLLLLNAISRGLDGMRQLIGFDRNGRAAKHEKTSFDIENPCRKLSF